MPAAAFALALGAAFLHALWNLLLAREEDPEAATAVAMVASVVVFAPVTIVLWDGVDSRVWPFVAVTAVLQLVYFLLLSTAYRRAELSFFYPVARGVAPVLVLAVGVVALGIGASAGQAVGVCLVGVGVVLVRGLRGGDTAGLAFGLVDRHRDRGLHPRRQARHRVRRSDHLPRARHGPRGGRATSCSHSALPSGRERVRSAVRLAPVSAGVITFAAYGLVLAALARAPAAPVAAVRETSVVIVAVLAAPLLGEHVDRMRVAGAGVVVLGVALLALD